MDMGRDGYIKIWRRKDACLENKQAVMEIGGGGGGLRRMGTTIT